MEDAVCNAPPPESASGPPAAPSAVSFVISSVPPPMPVPLLWVFAAPRISIAAPFFTNCTLPPIVPRKFVLDVWFTVKVTGVELRFVMTDALKFVPENRLPIVWLNPLRSSVPLVLKLVSPTMRLALVGSAFSTPSTRRPPCQIRDWVKTLPPTFR